MDFEHKVFQDGGKEVRITARKKCVRGKGNTTKDAAQVTVMENMT